MILVDKNIKSLAAEKKLIVTGYNENNVKGISYELTADCVYNQDREPVSSFDLKPGDVVYVRTTEEIDIPNDITARVIERNSVMRSGLRVDAPQYIPGHRTFCFLRVQNISDSLFTLQKGFKIAQIMFEELKEIPEQTYDKQKDAAFRNESDFIGAGRYQPEYNRLIKKFSNIKEDIEFLKDRIYGNVLTLMGVFVSIFTLVSINIQAFARETVTKSLVITVNLSLISSITIILGLTTLIVNKGRSRWFLIAYSVLIVILAVASLLSALL